MCRLNYESDLLDSIRRFADEKDVKFAVFFVLGAVEKARFSFYDQEKKRYLEDEIDEPMEVLSCIGNISKMKGETIVHGHIVLSNREGRSYGGHLRKGTIVFSAELFIMELERTVLEREYDEVTGLNLFKL
ncbi:MAG: PPC domain-containing DNA-binding protein [Candidatus Heimdallarchaeota archaeon]